MTKLEEVARAICGAELLLQSGGKIWPEDKLNRQVERYWPVHLPAARSVVEALKKPTDAMISASIHRMGDVSITDPWNRMCDAILEEKL